MKNVAQQVFINKSRCQMITDVFHLLQKATDAEEITIHRQELHAQRYRKAFVAIRERVVTIDRPNQMDKFILE